MPGCVQVEKSYDWMFPGSPCYQKHGKYLRLHLENFKELPVNNTAGFTATSS